ncbi:thioesterase superfamily protein [Segniliparus rotundus DSM 44985]|uniref:Thioesterase superfamily protein n=1 Tax=Segniliparus rotundus (strain ATCC BAA-972 / CDC 1076 / CIP 108378 / DSM 44985 / JCM 13578) TaxID=640132 RepID=D6ZCG7_SEGRD|nr:PaaI family thioesterase [Segniliparus rotundus]ADG97009.1 thioesterase superfamily protein [Segniliparus rotundus DSM 44985]
MTMPPEPRTPDSWGPARSKTVQWHDPAPNAAAGRRMSGAEYLAAMRDGRLPGPPISGLLGMELVSFGEGEVVFRCVPDDSAHNPIGVVHGGLVCALLDSVCGCAAHTMLPAGVGYTSIELKVSYVRPVRSGDELTAKGWLVKPGSRVSFAEGEVRNQDGKVVETASSSLLIMKP